MIKINFEPTDDLWNSEKNRWEHFSGGIFAFENSLRAIAKWESKYQIRYLDENVEKTNAQMLDYYSCMCLSDNFKIEYLTEEAVKQLYDYVSVKHTATTFSDNGNMRTSGPALSSELIYAYMTVSRVPFECDKWEIHRLLALLGCVGELQKPKKKMSLNESRSRALSMAQRNYALQKSRLK